MTEDSITMEVAATEADGQEKGNEKLLKLPLSKIRTIMKLDPDFNGASLEAVFLIGKATVSEERDLKRQI